MCILIIRIWGCMPKMIIECRWREKEFFMKKAMKSLLNWLEFRMNVRIVIKRNIFDGICKEMRWIWMSKWEKTNECCANGSFALFLASSTFIERNQIQVFTIKCISTTIVYIFFPSPPIFFSIILIIFSSIKIQWFTFFFLKFSLKNIKKLFSNIYIVM